MNIKKIILFTVLIGAIFLAGVFAIIPLALWGKGEKGDQNGNSGAMGTVSDEVPVPLAKVFNEVGDSLGVPPALLAAFSSVECGKLWSAPTDSLTNWIQTNGNPEEKGCCFNNGWNCWGPAQFLYSTWGLARPGDAPSGTPTSGTYGDKAAKYVSAPPFMCNVKEAVYAMALKIKNDSGGATTWSDEDIKRSAQSYCGSCDHPKACPNYCNNIIDRYHKYSSKL